MTSKVHNGNHNINQDNFVIFAELDRDRFDEILQALTKYFENIQYGRQGDDWIWIHVGEDKVEIDSFFSMQLEVKGKYKYLETVRQVIQKMENDWIVQVFNPPKADLTR